MIKRFADPDPTERFYAQALVTLTKPRRRTARTMRVLNIAYWAGVLMALSWLVSQAIDRAPPVVDRTQMLAGIGALPGAPLKVAYSLRRVRVCAANVSWTEIDGAGEVHRFGPKHVPVPGKAGPDGFTYEWPTSANATPGPSVLRVVIEFQCPGNYLQAFYPIVDELPDLAYETLGRGDGLVR